MSSLIVALFAVMIILAAMAGYATSSVQSQDQINYSVKVTRDTAGDISRTEVSSLGAIITSNTQLDFTLQNSGQSQFRQVSNWDVVVWYHGASGSGLEIERLIYTTSASPAIGEWTLTGIYEDAGTLNPEVYQPGIVNPSEQFIIRAELGPAVATSSTNTVTLAVEQGIAITEVFTN
ncbi:MAG: hypothetical protein HQ477_01195 [Chloroflexi bacterium]|nr:hypothetical protein [Chloroflexota bacterium]